MIFKLDDDFVAKYENVKPDFGFNGLGLLTYYRTYSRLKSNGVNEQWFETVRRVVEGCYSIQKEHIIHNELGWNDIKAQRSAQEMYDRMFKMKFLPPGRMLWALGTPIVHERKIGQALFNCAFVSTEKISKSLKEAVKPFLFMMDMSMVGVGVGFDVDGAGSITVNSPSGKEEVFSVPDDREGWVESLDKLLSSYFSKHFGVKSNSVKFDYSLVRAAGLPIKGFGGTSSGPEPLIKMHEQIREVLNSLDKKEITITAITDIMNMIGQCVVAGNVRRCLPKGTLVHCVDGLKKIEDVKAGDVVHTSSGTSEVSELVYQGPQQTVKIITQLGEFVCTEKHQIAVMTSPGEYMWKQANQLQKGDRLVFPEHISPGSDTKLPEWSYDKPKHSTTCKDIVIPELDENIAWFIGLIHGDGYVRPNFKEEGMNSYVSISCSTEHPKIMDKVIECFKRFGIVPSLIKQKGNWINITATSKQLAWYFDQIKKANVSIDVPDFILSGLPTIRAAYLAGLFDADGSSKGRPKCLVSTVYKNYIKQIQALYASLGIPTRSVEQASNNKRIAIGWQPIYKLNIVGENSIKRCEKFVMCHSEKYENKAMLVKSQNDYGYPSKWIIDSDLHWNKKWCADCKQMTLATFERCGGNTKGLIPITVKKIEIGDNLETYDISVPNAKEFIAQEGLLVHNTAQLVLGPADNKEYRKLKDYRWNSEKGKYEGSMAYRSAWGWASNNSVLTDNNSDFKEIGEQIAMNGEPGTVFLDNIRKYSRMSDPVDNKDIKVKGTNPCSEQSLESYELCCVSGDTRIMTKTGFPKIANVVGKEVEIWNGEEWSTVVPFLAAKNKDLYRVYLSDGSYLDVTDNHNWSVRRKTERAYKKVSTDQLEKGMILERFEFNSEYQGVKNEDAYSIGWITGDGYIDKKNIMAVVQKREYHVVENLNAIQYKEQHPSTYTEPFRRVKFSKTIGLDFAKELRNKEVGLPEEIFTWDKESLCNFFGGWIDTDGSVKNQENTDNYLIFSCNRKKLEDAQILLRRIGVNHSTIHEFRKAGDPTNYSKNSRGLWSLYIPSYECGNIKTILKKAVRIGSRYKFNNAHEVSKPIDRAVRQKVIKIEKLNGIHDTYCFSEKKRNMGVFGNCLTYQCLVETFPSRAESKEDYLRTLKFAYLLGKTATLINTTWPESNKVQKRNRRIGTSVTGVTNFLENNSLETLRIWLDSGYKEIKKWDEIYSSWLGIPESIKISSVKPSGTVSLLAGVNPGCHFSEFAYYIRRVRVAKNSALIPSIKKAGLHVEDDVVDPSSYVVEFPIHNGGKNLSQVNIWEQVALATFLQRWWADNQVSCTVTFRPEEANQIPIVLDYFKHDLKSISFLPKIELGAYAQMPYEAITKERYEKLMKGIKPVDFKGLKEDSVAEKFCDGDKCVI